MMPLLFGSSERSLYGFLSTGRGFPERRGVVICPPLGQEYIRSHRTCRVLADRVARTGGSVLRYDYFGTGDSAGADEDLTFDGAIGDSCAAVEEIVDVSGSRGVSLVGLRAGALVAAYTAAASPSIVDRLVLWDPITDGRAYVDRIKEEGHPIEESGHWESRGFLYTRAFLEELSQASMGMLDTFPPEVLIVVSEKRSEHRRLREHIEAGGSTAEVAFHGSPPPWEEASDLGVGAIPADAIVRITSWTT